MLELQRLSRPGKLLRRLRRASLGQAILATALDREMSNLMGINPQKVFALTAGDLPLTTGLHIPVDSGVAAGFLR